MITPVHDYYKNTTQSGDMTWAVGSMTGKGHMRYWKSPRGGVNWRNLKFINLRHNYKPGLALEIKSSPRERAKNKSKANEADDTVICFTEVRFLRTYSPFYRGLVLENLLLVASKKIRCSLSKNHRRSHLNNQQYSLVPQWSYRPINNIISTYTKR